ncbi:hypothetical protein ASPZODRAFT_148918 [Penicilliopsis zonata CBS 506.65]|uniref:Major facilitator superfamily (MFS) profile domain-containing protein n=1 Tax=Penicilliopsis zonata CBS 506.65 TaxID=1073090 RepID=A0A1L9SWZ3_9EURO|nr:hypothetical protein ASPZODRAFT_148918 [Penicilliopsis zonata CBS 506.65]OJJ51676.1 hypothetical protein ASPZODRAFT_148918 [Penicilliopsis zonata CBS 506.65]
MKLKLHAICSFAALGSFLFGYDSGVIASTIAQKAFLARFGSPTLSDAVAGAIVSSYTGGAILGSLSVSVLCDAYGRRAVICLGALLATLGAALQAGAASIAMLIVGRLLAGLAVGGMSTAIPVYCSEISLPAVRGMLISTQQWMIGVGIMVAQWVGYACSLRTGDFTWRFPLGLQVIPAVVLCVGIWQLPESPRWLIEHDGREEAGREILVRLHGAELAEKEFQSASQKQLSSRSTLGHFGSKEYRRILLACGIQLFTQTSGTNMIQNYGPRLYTTLGLQTSTSLLIIGVWGLLAVVWNTLFMLFIVDRFGRRTLLIPSLLGMACTMAVEASLAGYYLASSERGNNANALRAAISMFFVFTICYTSLGLISWIYPAEIFPTALRARGAALATATNWSFNLLFTQCSPLALSHLGYKYLYCFVAFNFLAAALVWLFFPETRGLSLDVDDHDHVQ